jgi:hypothetical protein
MWKYRSPHEASRFAVRKIIAEIFSPITAITRKCHRASQRGNQNGQPIRQGAFCQYLRFSIQLLGRPCFPFCSRAIEASSLPRSDKVVASQLFPVGMLVARAEHVPRPPKISPEKIPEHACGRHNDGFVEHGRSVITDKLKLSTSRSLCISSPSWKPRLAARSPNKVVHIICVIFSTAQGLSLGRILAFVPPGRGEAYRKPFMALH